MDTENRTNTSEQSDPDSTTKRKNSNSGINFIGIFDTVAKLIGACAIVAATVVANRYQSAITATNLLVQREQADSNLRAGMFRDLIGPLVGTSNGKGEISVDRERLLVELLALNFHDHFALKPLLIHIDDRLAHEEDSGMSQTQRTSARESLRSSARRVAQQQLSLLTKAESETTPEQQACIYYLQLDMRTLQSGKTTALSTLQPCSSMQRYFNDLISINSPNGLYTLAFTISPPKNWVDQNFDVFMSISRKDHQKDKMVQTPDNVEIEKKSNDYKNHRHVADQDFQLTWFDFPFSDNTLLADGTRFTLVIDRVEPVLQRVSLKLVWFPQDYFAAQERPTNHRQFREKLGLQVTQ